MKIKHLLLVAALFTCSSQSASAQAYKTFLKIEGITGSSTNTGHEGEIDVLSYKAGVVQRALTNLAGGGATSATSDFKPLTIFKGIDLATPPLLVSCAFGQHFPTATLSIFKLSNGVLRPFFKIVLSDVVIASVNEDSDTTDQTGVLVETVSLSYSKIQWTFSYQNSQGNFTDETIGFDVKANKKF